MYFVHFITLIKNPLYDYAKKNKGFEHWHLRQSCREMPMFEDPLFMDSFYLLHQYYQFGITRFVLISFHIEVAFLACVAFAVRGNQSM